MKNIIEIRGWMKPFILLLLASTLFACAGENEQQMLQKAKEYIAAEDIRAAIIELKNVLQTNPQNAEARYLLGDLSLRLGDMPSAEKEFRRAAESGWNDEEAKIGMAVAMLEQDRFEQLIDKVQAGSDWSVTAKANLFGLHAAAEAGLGRLGQAKATLSRGMALQQDAFHVLRTEALIQLIEGRFEAASDILDAALLKYPESMDLLSLRANTAALESKTDIARELYTRIIESEPGTMTFYSRKARLGIARMDIQDKQLEQAHAMLDPLINRNANDLEANYLSAVLVAQEKDFDKAEEYLDRILKLAPDHQPTLLMSGSVSFAKGDYEQAAHYLGKYVTVTPENQQARKLLGRTYMALEQYDEAQSTMRSSLGDDAGDPEMLALIGLSELSAGDVEAGIRELESAVALAPESTILRGELAKAYMAGGKADKAVTELEKVIQDSDDDYQAKYMMIIARLRIKEFDAAMNAAQKMQAEWPENPAVVNLMGVIETKRNNREAGRAYFEKALQMKPDFTDAIMNLAELDLIEGNQEAAEKKYRTVVDISAENSKALLALAGIAERSGSKQEQIGWLEKARQANKSDLESRVKLFQHYLLSNQLDEAEKLVMEIETEYPDQASALGARGQLLIVQQNYNQAVPVLKELINTQPNLAIGYYLSGLNQLKLGQLGDARFNLRKAYQINPNDFGNKVLLARTEQASGNHQEALKLGQELSQKSPQKPEGLVIQGDALVAMGKYQDAIKAYNSAWEITQSKELVIKRFNALRKAGANEDAYALLHGWLNKQPDDSYIHFVLAAAYEADGQDQKAILHYEKVLEKEPDNITVLNNLAWVFNKQQDQRALSLAERAYRQDPKSPAILDTYGWVLLQQGETEKALGILEQAAKALPDVAEVQYHKAVAVYRSGDKTAALSELKALLDSGVAFEGREDARAIVESN